MKPKYLTSDYRSLEIHRLVAQKVERNPFLLQKAIDNIKRWKNQNANPQPYLDDWMNHIDQGVEHLLSFLRSESDEGQRLRSSSPFVGIITQEERKEIFERFANSHDTRTA